MAHGAFAFTRQCRFQTGNACYPIALVDEVNMIYSAMGIDIWEVIGAAKTKPFGFMPSYPGLVSAGIISDQSVLSHMEGSRIRSIYAFHRVGRRDQYTDAQARCAHGRGCTQYLPRTWRVGAVQSRIRGTRWRTCPYRQEKFGRVIKATVDYTDFTDILEP